MPIHRTETRLGQKPTTSELFPDFRKPLAVLAFVFFSVCATLAVVAARYPLDPQPIIGFCVFLSLFMLIGGSWFSALNALVPRLKHRSILSSYALAWIYLQAITGITLAIIHWLLDGEISGRALPVIPTLVMSAAFGGMALRYFYINASWHFDQIQGQIAHSQALAARIRPHFLFNTLNTIAELTRTDPDGAEHAVEDLARLYRSSLANVQHKVSLADEINTAKSYLYIEQYRLGKRMQQSWDTDSLPQNAQLPILTLQPLVENAVYHGIEPCPEGGKLSIKGWVAGAELCLAISNPFPDVQHSNRQKGNNMAMDNIRQRLKMAFGKKAEMLVETVDNEYQVTLRFPYVTGEAQG